MVLKKNNPLYKKIRKPDKNGIMRTVYIKKKPTVSKTVPKVSAPRSSPKVNADFFNKLKQPPTSSKLVHPITPLSQRKPKGLSINVDTPKSPKSSKFNFELKTPPPTAERLRPLAGRPSYYRPTVPQTPPPSYSPITPSAPSPEASPVSYPSPIKLKPSSPKIIKNVENKIDELEAVKDEIVKLKKTNQSAQLLKKFVRADKLIIYIFKGLYHTYNNVLDWEKARKDAIRVRKLNHFIDNQKDNLKPSVLLDPIESIVDYSSSSPPSVMMNYLVKHMKTLLAVPSKVKNDYNNIIDYIYAPGRYRWTKKPNTFGFQKSAVQINSLDTSPRSISIRDFNSPPISPINNDRASSPITKRNIVRNKRLNHNHIVRASKQKIQRKSIKPKK